MSLDGTLRRSTPDPLSPRIGVRVRALVADGFITPGMAGQGDESRAHRRVGSGQLGNATACVIGLERLELVGDEQAAG